MNLEVARSYSVRCWHTESLKGQTGSIYMNVFITATGYQDRAGIKIHSGG